MAANPKVELAVSTVIFALRTENADDRAALWLPLVRRIREPWLDYWALPGGPLDSGESLADAASRTLGETTGLEPSYLEQLYAFGDPERSPQHRVVSIVYWALVHTEEIERTAADHNVQWFCADDIPELAFDHNQIVEYALWRLRNKMEYSSIAPALLGETFTLTELRKVYEAVLQKTIDPANFRRTIRSSRNLVATTEVVTGGRHRPPRLYRYHHPAISQPSENTIGNTTRSAS